MPQSYVPEDTTAVCTMMTNGSPQMIKLTNQRTVIFKGENKPLLNLEDNKLSGAFGCKAAAKFWGGLQALALGVALGAAVVLTGGAALVVIAAACAVSVVAGATALYKMAHDCDATLEIKWENEHSSVRINGKLAILNQSTLPCPKGPGKIDIIMDPAIAQEAAEYISNNNTKEVLAQMASQFAIGAIAMVTAPSSAAAAVSGGITLLMYGPAEWLSTNNGNVEGNIESTVITDVANSAIIKNGVAADLSEGIAKNVVANSDYIDDAWYAGKVAISGFLKDNPIDQGFGAYAAIRNLKDIKPQSFKLGIGGFLASLTIGVASDTYETNLSKDTVSKQRDFNKSDSQNGTTIIAQDS